LFRTIFPDCVIAVHLLDTDYHVYVWAGSEWRKKQEEETKKEPSLMLFFQAADVRTTKTITKTTIVRVQILKRKN